MNAARRWSVLLVNDELNSLHGVVYVLNRVLGVSPGAGLLMAAAVDGGSHVVSSFAEQARAEALAAELQVYGLSAAVREA